jgi:hypothetical protein
MNEHIDYTVEKIYYSAAIQNTTNEAIIATYNVNRSIPLLKNTQDWEISMVNFNVPSTSVPLFVFEEPGLVVGPAGNDLSVGYWVGLQLDTTQPITYVAVLNSPQQIFNMETNSGPELPYSNYIFDYQLFVGQVNIALSRAYTILEGDNTPPFIYYDPTTTLFTIHQDNRDPPYDGTHETWEDPDSLKIYFNEKLYSFFRFNATWNNSSFYAFDNPGNAEYIINFAITPSQPDLPLFSYPAVDTQFGTIPAPNLFSPTVSYYFTIQPYQTVSLWAQYNKLLFTTTSLPIALEQQSVIGGGSSAAFEPVVFSFNIPNDQKKDASDYNYQANTLKWVSMTTQQQLINFDINFKMQGATSEDVIPVYLLPGESVSFKLCFRLKSKLVRIKK